MENIGLYKKLHKIQESVSGLSKDKSANSYKYVTGDKVLKHIKPLMNELGILLKQEVLSIDNVRQDYIIGAKTERERMKSEIHSTVMMRFTWIDVETGQKDENTFGANGQNDWDKGVGSALTYAERYFLLKFFHIPTDEDDIDNPNRKDLKWATTNDLIQFAYNKYTINEVKEQFKVRDNQEQEYAELLIKYSNYQGISERIIQATTTDELVEISKELKADLSIYNDFKTALNNQHLKITSNGKK